MPKQYKYTSKITYEGKKYYVRADSQRELGQKIAEKKAELKNDTRILSPNTSVDEWRKQAIETYKTKCGEQALRDMRYRYDHYIHGVIGTIPISKVTPIQCQNILNQCQGMSYSQCDKLRQEIRFIFETALDNGIIRKNPATKINLPDCEKRSRRSITDKEREHLYKVLDTYEPFILFRVMIETGCRPSEAINLIGKDIDHKHMLLHIRGTKTANSDRYVPIPESLYAYIKDTKPFSYICPNSKGNKHNADSYKRICKHLKREMNLSMGCKTYRNALVSPLPLAEDFQPYCLRHTFCTDLCKAGVDVRTAQRLMGHANISITADIYTHVDTAEILKAKELMDAYRQIQNQKNA